MRPRPRPRQLQLPHPGHVLSLRLAISPCHRSSPSRSSAPPSRLPSPVPHCSLPFPSFRASLPCPPLPSSPVPPLLHSWLPLSFPHPLPLFSPGPSVLRALFSAPLPRPSLLLALPSPTVPRLAKGQISRGNQQRQTRCSDFIIVVIICHFSCSHKGQSRHGLNSGLTRRLSRPPAFSALSLFHNRSASLLLTAVISLQGVRLRVFSLPFLSPRSLSLPPSFLFHL